MVEYLKNVLHNKVSQRIRDWVKDYCRKNGLLTLSVLAVITGCVVGFMLRSLNLSTQFNFFLLSVITDINFLGLILFNMSYPELGNMTIFYYIVIKILIILTICFNKHVEDIIISPYRKNLVPNVKSIPLESQANYVYIMPDHDNPKMGHPVFLELTPAPEIHYKVVPGKSSQMNVLGIVIFSATMGLLLGRMGERGSPLVNVCLCINECVMKIINAAMWYFPFGIVFLVAGKILDMHDPVILAEKLGMYFITVLAGLFVHGVILLPMFFFIFTKKNPFSYIRGLLQALVIALATSSSSATLPITMKCLLENCHVDRKIARFVLPVGATINMDGTALYEAVAAIFIAQVNEYELDFGQLVTISITATAASIGAAGIPQAGLVTMVIVLTSVGLPPDDITLIVAIDWILDRFRTMINVLGDALAAGIMAHLCRKDFQPKGPPNNDQRRDTVTSYYGNQSVQSIPSSEVPLIANRDYILEVVGDQVIERPTAYYNLCQV
uniref:Amino acid transporter n=1 Tax=Astyanax mexicanus TaxID=7994 RepID=A0A8B9L764_ASTMX